MTEFPSPEFIRFAEPEDEYEQFYCWLTTLITFEKRPPTLKEFQEAIGKIEGWDPRVMVAPHRMTHCYPYGVVSNTEIPNPLSLNLWLLFWLLEYWELVEFLTQNYGDILTRLMMERSHYENMPLILQIYLKLPPSQLPPSRRRSQSSQHRKMYLDLIAATPRSANVLQSEVLSFDVLGQPMRPVLFSLRTPLEFLARTAVMLDKTDKKYCYFSFIVALIKAGGKLLPWPFTPTNQHLMGQRELEAQFHRLGADFLPIDLRNMVLAYAADLVFQTLSAPCPCPLYPLTEDLDQAQRCGRCLGDTTLNTLELQKPSNQESFYQLLASACEEAFRVGEKDDNKNKNKNKKRKNRI